MAGYNFYCHPEPTAAVLFATGPGSAEDTGLDSSSDLLGVAVGALPDAGTVEDVSFPGAGGHTLSLVLELIGRATVGAVTRSQGTG